ncbi:MAG: cysteine--tRNA ligase, partial [Bacteroidales bacterium]|nr:cysteine--tRNA ligase [Bacteroidales bacterium]
EEATSDNNEIADNLMKLIIDIRQDAKSNKDFATSDKIRDELAKLNISIKDTKDGADWKIDKL